MIPTVSSQETNYILDFTILVNYGAIKVSYHPIRNDLTSTLDYCGGEYSNCDMLPYKGDRWLIESLSD